MDPSKFTQKTIETLNNAQELAQENSHQQVTPIHVAIKLLEDPEGIAKQAILRNSNEETLRSILRVLNKKLVRLPSIDPPPDQVSQKTGCSYLCTFCMDKIFKKRRNFSS
jgi:ATP-dependent Clp protease ATP-binding subunit ClpB